MKKLGEQAKMLRKPCETNMYWHYLNSTRALMHHTEKMKKKLIKL